MVSQGWKRLLATFAVASMAAGSATQAGECRKGVIEFDRDRFQAGSTFFTGPDNIIRTVGMGGNQRKQWGEPADQISWGKPIFNGLGNVLAMTGFNEVPGYQILLPDTLVQFDRDGNKVNTWDNFPLSQGTFVALHHDMTRLENGNTLIVCLTRIDVPAISKNELLDDCLVEVDWQGNIVWEWYTFEHFHDFDFSPLAKALIYEAGGDWAHANSVSIIPENDHDDPAFTPGNIMISYREINTIVIIDRQTGDIVWRVGPDNNLTIGQHDAHMIEKGKPGAGNILTFDNGMQAGYPIQSRPFSQVVEIDPITKTPVSVYNGAFSGQAVWDFYSPIISGAQRLENGNTFITEGTKGRLVEVAPNGEIVWEYYNPYYDTGTGPTGLETRDFSVFRAYRMPRNWGE